MDSLRAGKGIPEQLKHKVRYHLSAEEYADWDAKTGGWDAISYLRGDDFDENDE